MNFPRLTETLGLPGFVGKHLGAVAAGVAATGALAGGLVQNSVDRDSDLTPGQRATRLMGGMFAGAVLTTGAVAAGSYVGRSKAVGAEIIRGVTGQYARNTRAAFRGFRAADAGISKAVGLTLLSRPLITAGAGAAIGAAIGSRSDNTAAGAAIGAAAGVVAPTMITGIASTWKGLGRSGPVGELGKIGLYGIAASAIFGIGRSLVSAPAAGQAYATPDGMGGYTYEDSPPAHSGMRERMDMMQATGGLVLGLHNGRGGASS